MGKKLNFWAELYSESHDLDTMDEFQLSAEEWDALSEVEKLSFVDDWVEGQINCGYTELGEEPNFEEEIDEEPEFSVEEEVEEYPENFDDEEDEWSDE